MFPWRSVAKSTRKRAVLLAILLEFLSFAESCGLLRHIELVFWVAQPDIGEHTPRNPVRGRRYMQLCKGGENQERWWIAKFMWIEGEVDKGYLKFLFAAGGALLGDGNVPGTGSCPCRSLKIGKPHQRDLPRHMYISTAHHFQFWPPCLPVVSVWWMLSNVSSMIWVFGEYGRWFSWKGAYPLTISTVIESKTTCL